MGVGRSVFFWDSFLASAVLFLASVYYFICFSKEAPVYPWKGSLACDCTLVDIALPCNDPKTLGYRKCEYVLDVAPPSNSDHQYYYMVSRESL